LLVTGVFNLLKTKRRPLYIKKSARTAL